ncbi:MAG: apolipoprotein N-acyltransferase [Hyphomicrobiaceae bacterium]|nr:apolipoprotein N-acyltransferase [Hyphomicrobiaceae bacterium]
MVAPAGIARGLAGAVAWLQDAPSLARAAVAFAAGSLSVLAMAPFFLAPILFLTLPVLVWLIDTADVNGRTEASNPSFVFDRGAIGRAGVAGWFFGFGYFVFGMFWIGEAFLVEAEKFAWLLPAAVTLLPAGLGLFFAAAAAAARAFWRPGLSRVLVLAIAFASAEWVRGHVFTGLPWNVIGYALTYPDAGMQAAGLVGVYGLTLVAIIAFAAPLTSLANAVSAASDGRRRAALSGVVIAAVLLGSHWAYGAARLAAATRDMVPDVVLRIVQPSVDQREKWQPDKQGQIFELHVALSRQTPAGKVDDLAGITHLVWPEAAMPFLPLESPGALDRIAAMLPPEAQLITGALRAERHGAAPADDAAIPREGAAAGAPRPDVYNSLMVFDTEGRLAASYDKIHLVPFGEYLPAQSALEAIGLEQLTRLRGGFTVGAKPRPILAVAGLPPLLGLICYEAIFPAAVVQGLARPGVIVNVTNDGWFGNTTGPRQHFHMARVRAVEEGVPVVRAANNGISAVIDPYGRVEGQLGLNERGVLDSGLPRALSAPLYAETGDLGFALLLGILALVAATGTRRNG